MVVRLATSDLPRYPTATEETYRALQLLAPSRQALRKAHGEFNAGLPPTEPAALAMTFSAFDDTLAPARAPHRVRHLRRVEVGQRLVVPEHAELVADQPPEAVEVGEAALEGLLERRAFPQAPRGDTRRRPRCRSRSGTPSPSRRRDSRRRL